MCLVGKDPMINSRLRNPYIPIDSSLFIQSLNCVSCQDIQSFHCSFVFRPWKRHLVLSGGGFPSVSGHVPISLGKIHGGVSVNRSIHRIWKIFSVSVMVCLFLVNIQ